MESIVNLFGVEWVMPIRVIDLLVSWEGHVGRGVIVEVWRLASLCLMWCIWREMNVWSFKDIETSVTELRKIMFNTFYRHLFLALS